MNMAKKDKIKKSVESMEKYFFAYILENPKFIHRVVPIYFINDKIRFVYECLRENFLSMEIPKIPSIQKAIELVRMYDLDSTKVSNEFIERAMSVQTAEIVSGDEDDYLKKTFYSWITSRGMYGGMTSIIEIIQNMDPTDYSNTVELSEKIRNMMTDATLMNFDDDDLGLDFFDPESHLQETLKNKISTGWSSIDELLSGGWDRKTLNLILGGTNSGKSLWLGNIAVNASNYGKNVLYITLEMSSKKVMKRMGANRLKIHIDEYDTKSKDTHFMTKKLNALKKQTAFTSSDSDMFKNTLGHLYVKEFPSGSCTVADVDNTIKNFENKKNIKIDLVVVDYLTIMSPEKSKDMNLFTNGKYLSNGLRAIAQKRDLVMVTAMQIGKDSYGANDINLGDVSESKAIIENTDVCFGIIRTDAMRRENKYQLKLLKIRDGGFKWERTHFELNTSFLSIEKDKKMDSTN